MKMKPNDTFMRVILSLCFLLLNENSFSLHMLGVLGPEIDILDMEVKVPLVKLTGPNELSVWNGIPSFLICVVAVVRMRDPSGNTHVWTQ